MVCEMCGAEGQLFKAVVEGAQMTVCEKCSKFGKMITKLRTSEEIKHDIKREVKRSAVKKTETMFVIVDNYSGLVKKGREKMGLKQEDVAKKIAEKESLLHKIETGNFEPDMDLARKLEKFFNIKLIEQHEETHEVSEMEEREGMTLGDMIKLK